MSSPLPFRPSIDHTPSSKSVLGLADGGSAAVFESLSSETARSILETLEDGPATTSDLADAIDTSLQNIHYHLEKLIEADLVTEVGTWYSAKGKEMSVYAPTTERIEIRFTTETHESITDPRLVERDRSSRLVSRTD